MNETNPPGAGDERASTSAVVQRPARSDTIPAGQDARRSGRLALVLAVVAIALSAAFAATAFFIWNDLQQIAGVQAGLGQRVDEGVAPVRQSIDALSRAVTSSDEKLEQTVQDLERRLEALAEDQRTYENRLNVLGALMGRSEQGWGLAEVEYLLRIANQRLQVQRDIDTAEAALRSADARLREIADPVYLSVREQIARDLEALAAVPEVDRTGIASTLSAALERVDALPVAGARYEPGPGAGDRTGAETTARDWKELPAVVWQALKSLFELREHDKPVKPMLPPEREYFLRENLRLQLSAARLALMREDTAQYRAALGTASDWLASHFAGGDPEVTALVSRFEELAAIDVRPELPDASASLRLLHQQMQLARQQDVLPRVPASGAPAVESEATGDAGDRQEPEAP